MALGIAAEKAVHATRPAARDMGHDLKLNDMGNSSLKARNNMVTKL
jgi:hypothetical protein